MFQILLQKERKGKKFPVKNKTTKKKKVKLKGRRKKAEVKDISEKKIVIERDKGIEEIVTGKVGIKQNEMKNTETRREQGDKNF